MDNKFHISRQSYLATFALCGFLAALGAANGEEQGPNYTNMGYEFISTFPLDPKPSEADAKAEFVTAVQNSYGCPPTLQDNGGWHWGAYNIGSYPYQFVKFGHKEFKLLVANNPPACSNQLTLDETLLMQRFYLSSACDPGYNGPFEVAPNGPWYACRDDEQNFVGNPLTTDCSPVAGNPCELTTGTKIERVVDYSAPGIEFYRTHRSNMNMLQLEMWTGANPTESYDQTPGKNWTHNYGSFILFDSSPWRPSHWIDPDGRMVKLFEIEDDVYVAEDGSGVQLRPVAPPGDEFSDWTIYLPSGAKEVHKRHLSALPWGPYRPYLKERHDPQGNVTTVNYGGASQGREVGRNVDSVVGPFGHTLRFDYLSGGTSGSPYRVMDSFLDPAGMKVDFVHVEGDPAAASEWLKGVIYQDQESVQYRYEDNTPGYWGLSDYFVRGIIDEKGAEYATFTYYDVDTNQQDLRVKSTQHGSYEWTGFEYAYTGESATVTDAGGNKTVYLFQATPGLNPFDWEPDWVARNPDTITGPDTFASSQANEPSGQRRVTQSGDENGVITKFEYDNFHLVSKKEDYDVGTGNGARETTYQYLNDTSDLKTLVREPSAACPGQYKDTVTTYVPDKQWVATITETGYSPQDCGTLISRTITYSDFNEYGQPRRIDGPRSVNFLDIEYYECVYGAECGQIKSVANALGHMTNFQAYDAHGRLQQVTDPNGLVTTYTYTLRGFIDTINQNDGVSAPRVIDYTYDPVGQIDFISLPEGLSLDFHWNGAHLLEYIDDAAGNRIEYSYDSRGNRDAEYLKDSGGAIQKSLTMVYDARNLLDSLQEGASAAASIDYGPARTLDDVTDPNSNTLGFGNIVTDYQYDSLNRLDKVIDALNGATSPTDYGYDVQDNLTSVIAPNGAATTYVHDDLGNLLQETSPDRGTTLYGYDEAGNMTCKADGRHTTIENFCTSVPGHWVYTYDALNRMDTIDYGATAFNPDVDYDYDGANELGRLDAARQKSDTGEIVETQYDYNLFGNLTEQRQYIPNSPVSPDPYVKEIKYDGNDQIMEITYPSGRIVNYERNIAGRVWRIKTTSPVFPYDETTVVTKALYKPFGPPRLIAFNSGFASTRAYDTAYRVTNAHLAKIAPPYTPVASHVYVPDEVGNVIQDMDILDSNNTRVYKYDELHRLIDDTKVETESADTYVYDANGNRKSRVDGGSNFSGQTIDYVSNSNRISTFNTIPASYDGAGNTTDVYNYNAANRLGQIDWSSESMSIIYNGVGELARTSRQPPCSCGSCPPSIRFYYHFASDGRALGMVDLSSGNGQRVERDWIWLDGIPVAQFQESFSSTGAHLGTQTIYLHTDQLGTPRMGIDDTGTPKWVYGSDAFGWPLIWQEDVFIPLRMPGQIDYEFGPSGIFYNYYRDYDSSTGRYLESDPIGLQGGLNTYGYVRGNPLIGIDPLGLVEWNGYLVYEGIGAGITTNFFNWYLESKCFEGEKLEVLIRGESDFFSSLSVGASSMKGGAKITLFDPWDAPSASNLSRTGSNSFVVEALGLGLAGASNVALGDATTAGWDWGLIRGGLDFSFSRIAGRTEILKEERTFCSCEVQ